MLLGQNFRRRHQRRLQAVFRREVNSRRRDHRFAAAHVALHQPVHRPLRRHVAQNIVHRAGLRAGERERQRAEKRRHIDRRAGLALYGRPPCAQQPQPEREEVQLLEREPPPRRRQRRVVRGEMDILVGIPHIAQPMLPPQLRREQVGQPVRSLVQPLPDGAVEQALPHARRQRIDRHDAAGDGVQPLPLKDGIRHRPPQQRPLDRAVERVALAHVERVFQVRLVEVRQLQRGALIHHAQLDELQSLSDARELRLRRHHRRHAGALTDLQLRDAAALPPVLVGAREIGDETFQVCDAELRKALRPRLAHAPDKAHIGIQLRHGPRLLSENLSSLYSFSPHLKRAFRSCGKPLFPYVLRT